MTKEELSNLADHDLLIEIYTDLKTMKEQVKVIPEIQKLLAIHDEKIKNTDEKLTAHTSKDNWVAGLGGFGIVVALLLDFLKFKP